MNGVDHKIPCLPHKLETNGSLQYDNPEGQPSIPSFYRVVLTFHSVPSVNVMPCLLESDVSQEEPDQKSEHNKWVGGRNPKSINHEEASEEIDSDNEDSIAEPTESSMTMPDSPIDDLILSLSSKPVVLLELDPFTEFEAEDDSGGVREEDIVEDVVPPALSEMREDVLGAQLKDLVQD